MRAFLVDDTELSRSTLKYMLGTYCPGLSIVGESGSFADAVLQLQQIETDILFLDVNLDGGKTGFDVLASLQDFGASVIVITAHKEYAYEAFHYAAVHFILKPVDPKELVTAVERVGSSPKEVSPSPQISAQIALPYKTGMEMVEVDDIIYIEADGSYTKIILKNEKIVVLSKNLKRLTAELSPYPQFIRVHKTYVVNRKHISGYLRDNRGTLELAARYPIPVSSTYKDEILKLFQ